MTRDDIILMAQEVGFVAYGEDAGEYRIPAPAFHSRIERFAALVAAVEREACAQACEEYAKRHDPSQDTWTIRMLTEGGKMLYEGMWGGATNCAGMIRARGDA